MTTSNTMDISTRLARRANVYNGLINYEIQVSNNATVVTAPRNAWTKGILPSVILSLAWAALITLIVQTLPGPVSKSAFAVLLLAGVVLFCLWPLYVRVIHHVLTGAHRPLLCIDHQTKMVRIRAGSESLPLSKVAAWCSLIYLDELQLHGELQIAVHHEGGDKFHLIAAGVGENVSVFQAIVNDLSERTRIPGVNVEQ